MSAFLFLLPLCAYAQEQVVKLSENGIEVAVALPSDCIVQSQTSPSHTISTMGSIQAIMEINDTTVEKETEFVERVYEGLKESYPNTTCFEEMPDLVTDMGTFTVRKTTYNNENDKPAMSLQAFCKLNYHYIYSITLMMMETLNMIY